MANRRPAWAIQRDHNAVDWSHLAHAHNLPSLTQGAYARNRKLWDLVDQRLHEAHERGVRYGVEAAWDALQEHAYPTLESLCQALDIP